MDANLDNIAKELYGKIQTRFPSIKIGDGEGKVLSKKEQVPQARFFEFEYSEGGNPLGTITMKLDQDDGLVVQMSGDLTNDNGADTSHNAFRWIRSFRQFAKDRLLKFDAVNMGKSNLDKRDYEFQAKSGEGNMMESKLFGTAKVSYQDLGEARLIIKHSQPVNTELAAGRTMHIESIYIENAGGERFKFPFKSINGARALAEHIKAGGNPYDSIGQHVIGLSEELASLRKFKNYVGRQEQLSEAMGDITSKVMERIDQIKETIHKLQRPTYYKEFAESFEAHEEQMIPEDVMTDWVDRLTIRTFNEELKSVFPYIYKLVDGIELPVKELGFDDLLSETEEEEVAVEDDTTEGYTANDAEQELEEFFNQVVSEEENEPNRLFSDNDAVQQKAIEDLNAIFKSGQLDNGGDGLNAIQTLKGIIDDEQLASDLKDIDSDLDVTAVIQTFLTNYDQENGTDIAQKVDFNGDGDQASGAEAPASAAAPAAPEAPVAATPPAAPEAPVAAAPAEEPVPAPVAEGHDDMDPPWDTDGDEKQNFKKPAKNPIDRVQALRNRGLKAAIAKAAKAGAGLDTVFTAGGKTMTLHDAIEECGMTPMECGFESNGATPEEMQKFLSGFWNREERNFTIGGERAKIKLEKQFPDANPELLQKMFSFIDKVDPGQGGHEQHDVLRLAGVGQSGHDHHVDEEMPDFAGMMKGMGGGDFNSMFNQIKSMPGAKVSNTSTGTIDGKPASYDDAMAKAKGMNFKLPAFGDNDTEDDFDFSNPQDMFQKIQGKIGKVGGNMGQGGQMNPQDMMKSIMSKMPQDAGMGGMMKGIGGKTSNAAPAVSADDSTAPPVSAKQLSQNETMKNIMGKLNFGK